MAVLVEHEKRKRAILEKALELFMEEGYESVTFQKVADRCGITRTTLYIYFKNKREIFLYSLKQLTGGLEENLLEVVEKEQRADETLRELFALLFCRFEENEQLFKVLLTYLIQVQKSGVDVNKRVNSRVIRIKHILNTVIIRGQKKGELRKLPVKDIAGMLYGFFIQAVFSIAVLGKKNIDDIRELTGFAIDGITIPATE